MCLRRLCLLCGGGRSSRVEAGRRGWSSPGHLAAKAGGGGGSGRQRGLLPSTPASSPMMRARPSRSAPNSRWRRAPSFTTMLKRPRVPRPASPTALLGCRHGALTAPGVQNGGDQPRYHAARHRSAPETQRKHQVIAWFPGDTQATEALIPSVLDTPGPTSPANRFPSRTTPRGPRRGP